MTVNCPSCLSATELLTAVCAKCGWVFKRPGVLPTIPQPAVRPKIPCNVTLGMTIDRTGSSQAFSVGIPLTFEMILRQVAVKARSVTVGLQSHGDLDLGENMILLTDQGTPDQAIDDVRRIVYGGGGDCEEHHLDAIENLLRTVAWPADPGRGRGAIIAFTTAETKPCRSGMSAAALGAEIRQRGILLYLVSEPAPILQELIDAAAGILLPISNNPDPQALEKIASQLSASILATLSSGSTEPMPVCA